MIQSNRNQLGNAKNPYQGTYKKVLTVCSAGLLRSPTLAKVLQEEFDYNVRACGTSSEYALIPLSQALAYWADEIVFVSETNFKVSGIKQEDYPNTKIIVLDIPDTYEYNDSELRSICLEQYNKSK